MLMLYICLCSFCLSVFLCMFDQCVRSTATVSLNDLLLRGNDDAHQAYLQANVGNRCCVIPHSFDNTCASIISDENTAESLSCASVEKESKLWSLFGGLPFSSSASSSTSRGSCGSWYHADSSQFNVRTKGYSDTGLKLPGAAALYNMVGMDIVTKGGVTNLVKTQQDKIREKVIVFV